MSCTNVHCPCPCSHLMKSPRPLRSLCFLGRSEEQDGRPGLWLAETFSTSLQPLNGIKRNLTWSKISTSSIKFVFWVDWKNKMSALASDWLSHFRFLLRKTLNGIQRNLTGSKISTSSYKFLVHLSRPSSVRPSVVNFSHFWLLLWKRWTEFNEIWQEARS